MDVAELMPVRLVRCPKCKNLLPEVLDSPLYLCGGCGTVLEGNRNQGRNGSLLNSDATDRDGFMVKMSEVGIAEAMEVRGISDSEVIRSKEAELRTVYGGSGTVKGMNQDLPVGGDVNRTEEKAKAPWVNERENFRAKLDHMSESSKSARWMQLGEEDYKERHSHLVERPSKGSITKLPYHEDDRAELLRKLEELQEQLSRSHLNHQLEASSIGNGHNSLAYGVHPSMQNFNQIPLPGQFHYNPHLFEPYHFPSNFHPAMCPCCHCVGQNHQNMSRIRPRWTNAEMNHPSNFNRWKVPSRGKMYHPKAGGSPFISCKKCSDLIVLPEKVLLKDGKWQKLQCGSCSAIITVSLANKKLIISTSSEQTQPPDAANEASQSDFDHSGYDFHAEDPDPDPLPLPPAKPVELQSLSSSSSSFYKNGDSVEQKLKSNHSEPHEDSSDQNCKIPQEVSMATETEVSYGEYSNNGVSGDFISHSTDPQSKSSKSESFFTNFIKNFKDTKGTHSDDDSDAVSVNGHVIPRKLVLKAEKLAGPIYPGNYWYDSRAGFWGVTGGHCLGMIPTSIKEFNHPMPGNCSSGDTNVFVNGRELHRKDLELLSSRGLPTEPNRYYSISISGKVVNDDTGEELESLGKLAPTIERRKLGFGMKVPKIIPPACS